MHGSAVHFVHIATGHVVKPTPWMRARMRPIRVRTCSSREPALQRQVFLSNEEWSYPLHLRSQIQSSFISEIYPPKKQHLGQHRRASEWSYRLHKAIIKATEVYFGNKPPCPATSASFLKMLKSKSSDTNPKRGGVSEETPSLRKITPAYRVR